MVADVTETRNVIPSLEFKSCMTIKSYGWFSFSTLSVLSGLRVTRTATT